MCLTPIYLYDTGRLTSNGKRLLSSKYSEVYLSRPPIPVPCGKCVACRETRRNEWIKRMLLESTLHPFSSFVTLTYDNRHLPSDFRCSKRDLQLFFKRLRHASRDYGVKNSSFKYFAVCEYGRLTHRPHYHAILFGLDVLSSDWRPFLVGVDKYPRISSSVLSDIWSNGFVLCDRTSFNNIRYVSKYITKDDVDCWSLHSIGLGRDLFVDSSCLSDFAVSTFKNGFVSVPSSAGFSKVRPPKFLDRYVERYAPELYLLEKERRRNFVNLSSMQDLAALRSRLNHQSAQENKRRILDNEKAIRYS